MRTTTMLTLGIAVIAACSDASKNPVVYTPNGPQPYPQKVASLDVSPTKLSVHVGANSRLSATAKDAVGAVH